MPPPKGLRINDSDLLAFRGARLPDGYAWDNDVQQVVGSTNGGIAQSTRSDTRKRVCGTLETRESTALTFAPK